MKTFLLSLTIGFLALVGDSGKSIYQFSMKTIDGEAKSLADYKGEVVLIVNTASECGFTYQYEGLEKLYKKYKDQGFKVLGFPANNFGAQEPGSNQQIKQFCTSKFDVTFPMFEKISVKGEDMHPLYAYLSNKSENGTVDQAPKWNFYKYLVNKEGKVVASFSSRVKPMSDELTSEIEALLK